MELGDVAACEQVWHDLRRRFHLPEVEESTAVGERMRASRTWLLQIASPAPTGS
jgi:hypothetical protein